MKKWEIVGKSNVRGQMSKASDIVDILLKNRGIRTKKKREEFFNPTPPEKISVKSLSLSTREISKAINRIKKAKDKKEKVIVFGDYDADGVCATAIMWECLYSLGIDALPYIPERFSEGYGLKEESVRSLREKYKKLGLIITVDNGIVANEAVDEANKLGIDVIITDHHLPRTHAPRQRKRSSRGEGSAVRGQKGKKLPRAHAIIHTTKIGGAGIAWIFTRETAKKLQTSLPASASRQAMQVGKTPKLQGGLELAAIGTIADQLPLIGPNRSFAKYGLEALNKTERVGLLALFQEAAIKPGNLGTYEVNFIIAPRINAMGRLEHAIDSLRVLCTKSQTRASDLALQLGRTNVERKKIVEEVVGHAKSVAEKRDWEGVIVLYHESYHEGVIGLAASRLVEEFYRPAIVFSKGESRSKASARSIPGFNIINAIRKLDDMLLDGGGHPMAAGFTIETEQIDKFAQELERLSSPLLTEELLTRRLKIDLELEFSQLNWKLSDAIKNFEPTGIGNPTPAFVSKEVNMLTARVVGRNGRHLKLTLEQKGKIFDAIAFGFADYYAKLSPEIPIDVVYRLEENVWNDQKSLQLKVRDIKLGE